MLIHEGMNDMSDKVVTITIKKEWRYLNKYLSV